MWSRFAEQLRCPVSGQPLRLESFQEHHVEISAKDLEEARRHALTTDSSFTTYVETGLLVSEAGFMYPIVSGVPVMLPYSTAIHERFAAEHAVRLTGFATYAFPHEAPAPGEEDVFRSFSEEWREYQYDGVLWDVSYDDNFSRLLAEVGLSREAWRGRRWIEVGCGIGMTTRQAQQLSGSDAVGIDLSIAIFKAAAQFRANPFLHFAQASAFALPLAPASFDIVYSRGVLHHTYSTRKAFLSVAKVAKPGARVYLWVYGPGSLRASPLRVAAFTAEALMRPVLSRLPARVATAALTPIAAGYLAFNRLRRWRDPEVQPYTFYRALHAARDRFTPRFAFRQSAAEVMQWFEEGDCADLEVVDWRSIPSADQDDYRRNTGVRGTARRA